MELYAGELVVLLGPRERQIDALNILGGLDTATAARLLPGAGPSPGPMNGPDRISPFHVGFVFHSYNLISSLTARENVAVVTEIAGNPMVPEEALPRGALRPAGPFPRQLSAASSSAWRSPRAISKNPEVLLCDEPRERSIPKRDRGPRSPGAGQPRSGHGNGDHHPQLDIAGWPTGSSI